MGLAFPEIEYKATHNVFGLTLNNPITLIRKPNECIPSWIAFYPKPETFEHRLVKVIAWYERFHFALLNSKSKVFCFYQATSESVKFTQTLEICVNQQSKSFEQKKLNINKNPHNYQKLSENDTKLQKCFELYNALKEKHLC